MVVWVVGILVDVMGDFVVVTVEGTGGVVTCSQNSCPFPQCPKSEQHGALVGQSLSVSHTLEVVVVGTGFAVVVCVVGFVGSQQNSSPVPQCPNTEQHSPIASLQSESE